MSIYNEILRSEVRALSWKQPYASLMLHGKIETRTWPTKYRGWVLICASKKPYSGVEFLGISGMEQGERILSLKRAYDMDEPLGKAIAIGKLVDCRPMVKEDEDKCFVEFKQGLLCHVYEDVEAIHPFDWKGFQGWRKLDYWQRKDVVLALHTHRENESLKG